MPGTRLQVEKIEPHEKDKGITEVYLQEQSVAGKEAPMPILKSSEHQYEQMLSGITSKMAKPLLGSKFHCAGRHGTLVKINAINGKSTSNIELDPKPKEVYFDVWN
ncbi:unnamed protein product [Rotaria sordida]|uniref:Uncharacterized protein n=1 Tax=Rotaria sordida TaxID=392033 RepID=A0A819YS53_9BILA|nr:unnamed protein product [Rotaria sordida]